MSLKRFITVTLVALVLVGSFYSWNLYNRIYSVNVELEGDSYELLIGSSMEYPDILSALKASGILNDVESFDWVAQRKRYPELVKPGRYIILDGMNNNRLINLLRSGEQVPIDVIVRSVRTKAELAGAVGRNLELDSAELHAALNDPNICRKYGFDQTTFLTMFLPNTYEFYWNTSVDEFIIRMAREYKRFWSDDRMDKARAIGMSQSEVSILASIVQSEQAAHPDERPAVAGLYLNRLRKGMRLESDPTLIYAIGDFSIKRVLNVHKKVQSRYNTYIYSGLPPGPILLPELSSIDAVLNAEEHRYIFMCAKEDFSGYHNFASNYRDHINNARRYQRELNRRKIYN